MGLREGVILDNYIIDATDPGAGNDKWTSTTVQSYTVPTGRRWALQGGSVKRDTQTGTATLDVSIFNAADKLIQILSQEANAAATTPYPDVTFTGYLQFPLPMAAGWYVKVVVGEAQGAAATATCVVRELQG